MEEDLAEETQVKVARMASSGEDWRKGKNIVECNLYMLDNELHTDVMFNVKTSLILAHRNILISRSPVFEIELANKPSSQIIQVDDVEQAIFKKMLRYMYCDHIDINHDEAASLLNVSRRYKLSGLEDLCVQMMRTAVTLDSVCIVLNHAVQQQLRERCLDFIFSHPEQVMNSVGFNDLEPESLKMIVKDDQFNVKEELIFEALIKWSDALCRRKNMTVNKINQNDVLRDMIGLVRFGLMEPKYIKEKVKVFLASDLYVGVMEELAEMGDNTDQIRKKRGQVVTPDDSNSVSSTQTSNNGSNRVFATQENSSQNNVMDPQNVPNNTRVLHPRTNPTQPAQQSNQTNAVTRSDSVRPVEQVQRYAMEHRERVRLGYVIEREQRIIVERFEATQSGKAYTRSNMDGISFIASGNLKLHGLLVYGSHQRPGTYKIELEIFKDPGTGGSNLERVYAKSIDMTTDGATKVYELLINPPVYITEQKVYTIRALFKGQASFYGVQGKHTVLKNGLSVNFVTDTTCLNLTSTEIGQFPGLIFEQV